MCTLSCSQPCPLATWRAYLIRSFVSIAGIAIVPFKLAYPSKVRAFVRQPAFARAPPHDESHPLVVLPHGAHSQLFTYLSTLHRTRHHLGAVPSAPVVVFPPVCKRSIIS